MKIKRRKIFINQTERQVSLSVKPTRMFCPKCGQEVEMVSINQAVKKTGQNWEEIIHWIKTETVHPVETQTGEVFICSDSLTAV